MTITWAEPPQTMRVVRRFFRTPKGLLLIVFAAILALALPVVGPGLVLPGLLSAAVTAAVLDVLLFRAVRRAWMFPSGALLSGLIIAMVLGPEEPLHVGMTCAAVAIASKYLFRLGPANIFNPAALALVVSSLLFGSAQSWWGALPDLGLAGVAVVAAGGVFIADRVNKLPLVLSFLGGYFLLFTTASFFGDAARFAEFFRAPDLHAALFFAFFMLDDPPTCPVRYSDQVQFAVVVALISYTVFMLLGGVYYLPAGLLAGNLYEAWRRLLTRPALRRAAAAG